MTCADQVQFWDQNEHVSSATGVIIHATPMKHMGRQKTRKHVRWMLHEQMVTISKGLLLILMQKRCNYRVLWTNISTECAIKHNAAKHVTWILTTAAYTQTDVDKMFDKWKASVIIYQ
jgi:hypothetical protein